MDVFLKDKTCTPSLLVENMHTNITIKFPMVLYKRMLFEHLSHTSSFCHGVFQTNHRLPPILYKVGVGVAFLFIALYLSCHSPFSKISFHYPTFFPSYTISYTSGDGL